MIRAELSEFSRPLSPEMSFDILRRYGVPAVRSSVAANVDEAVDQARDIGYPLVVKVALRDIQHRSDVGGVVLGDTRRCEGDRGRNGRITRACNTRSST
ncbi:acetate--CoA ligase family protein [Rhizobium sp. RAF56]|uniref:acetate--CoA ligase family protein n=1 Tax=Rhizobium sp. RAF56 TaxID=3233062 RepID=UPI003F977AA4